jgi:hypothetical protein
MITYNRLGKHGRLGNQLFQISATYVHAIKNGFDYSFPIWEYNKYLEKEIRTSEHLPFFSNFNERDPFKYSPIPNNDNINLNGYFQNELYFKEYRKEILSLLKPNKEIEEKIEEWYKDIGFNKLTSIHIRRGDYLKFPGHHPIVSLEYYLDSISLLLNETEKYIVFSDDINWCKQNLSGDFYFSDEKDDFMDLLKMAKCTNHIIANSSFSWWGSYLSPNEGKTIAPSQWVGREYMNTGWKEVYREKMIIL